MVRLKLRLGRDIHGNPNTLNSAWQRMDSTRWYGMGWYGMVWYGMGGQTFVGGVKRRKETWPCIWVYPQRVEEIMVLLHGL